MIELQTGNITFPELGITLLPLLHHTDFITRFPKENIMEIRDMKNGYIWYDIREKIYDCKIPVHICFNPQKRLEFIDLYPQFSCLNTNSTWENLTLEQVEKDKKYCDEWLLRFCNLQSGLNSFAWGSISVYFDPRSCCSGIWIHYIVSL